MKKNLSMKFRILCGKKDQAVRENRETEGFLYKMIAIEVGRGCYRLDLYLLSIKASELHYVIWNSNSSGF